MSSARVFCMPMSCAEASLLRCCTCRACSLAVRTSLSTCRRDSFSFCRRRLAPSVLSLLLFQRSHKASRLLIWATRAVALRWSSSFLRWLADNLSELRFCWDSSWLRESRLNCSLRATSFLMLGYLSASCFLSSITSSSRILMVDCFSSTSPSPRLISFSSSKLLRPSSMCLDCRPLCCSLMAASSFSLASQRGRSRSLLACTFSMSSLSESSLARCMEQLFCSWCISKRRESYCLVTEEWYSVNSITFRKAGMMIAGVGFANCWSEHATPNLLSISFTMNILCRKGRLSRCRSMSSPIAWVSDTNMLRMAAGSQGWRQCVNISQIRA